jgi:DNA polymerase-3 subunit alpha
MTGFVHLRIHSDFSLSCGLAKPAALVDAVAAHGYPSMALTDRGNLFGLVKYYRAARRACLKPVCGADLCVTDDEGRRGRVTLLVMNQSGWKNLTCLLSALYTSGQAAGKDEPALSLAMLAASAEGLILVDLSREGLVGSALRAGNLAQAESAARVWLDQFGDRFYLEVLRTGREGDDEHVIAAAGLSGQIQVPLVATNDVFFLEREDFDVHEARVCISKGLTLDHPDRQSGFSEEQYLKSPEEMQALFSDLPQALENAVGIAQRCNVEIKLDTPFLPRFPVPDGSTEEDWLRKVSFEGLENRFATLAQGPGIFGARDDYIERLEFELDVIISMGFPGYFLIVMDFIRWAKDQGIPVGPGRGSGAGSLVAYVLGITDLDPIRYDLLFERFLNPERVSLPDFDVDFCMDRRDEVIDYVAQRYGRDAVSQIITFGAMAAKAVVRDAARVLGRPYSLGDRISKMIPGAPGTTLEKALDPEKNEQSLDLKNWIDNDEEVREIWNLAKRLEGRVRNLGKHAGGVVIAPSKLTDFVPLYKAPDEPGLVSQFDKDDVEAAGLVKFDFLGLKTLTIIDWALKMLNAERASREEPPVCIEALPLDDSRTFELLKKGETTAVFQLESQGMKELIKRLMPSCFEDIVALVALYRPGPLEAGMDEDYINCKHGRKTVSFPHPDLEPVLGNTYGTILYQEQVMQIAQVLAGYSLGQADMLRRAMGKKKPEEMARQREIFAQGAANNRIDAALATSIFDLMEKFAGYGFNKSHSAAYALVSYQTAWLKTWYPSFFMAAVMTADMINTDKLVIMVEEAQRIGLEVMPPDVNLSALVFTVPENGKIRYGLGAVKGLGEGPVATLLEARKKGPFKDLFDFCARVRISGKFNKRTIEAMIRSGAMDSLGPAPKNQVLNRPVMLASLPRAMASAEQAERQESQGLVDMFAAFTVPEDEQPDWVSVSPGQLREVLGWEKSVLGLYLSGHPVTQYASEVSAMTSCSIRQLQASDQVMTIAGFVLDLRIVANKNGRKMAILTLDDGAGRIEATVFSDVFEATRDKIQKDGFVFLKGKAQQDKYRDRLGFRVESVMTLEDARAQHKAHLDIVLSPEQVTPDAVHALQSLIQSSPGRCQVRFRLVGQTIEGTLVADGAWSVAPTDDLLHEVALLFNLEAKGVCELA